MPEPELSLLFVRPLNRLSIRYIVSGSVAAILYGEPRLTYDVDFVVFLRAGDIPRLRDAFASPAYHVPPVDVIAGEVAREYKGHFNLIHSDTGFKADFYTSGRDELPAWAFRNARRMEYEREPFLVAPPSTSSSASSNTIAKGGRRSICAISVPFSPCRARNFIGANWKNRSSSAA